MAANTIVYEVELDDRKFTAGLDKISQRITTLNSQLKGLTMPSAGNNLTNSLNSTAKAMDGATKSAKGLGDTGFWLNSSFGQITHGLNKYSFASLGATVRVNALVAGLTVLSGAVMKSLDVFMDYEKVLTSIKVLGGLTTEEMSKLSKEIDNVAQATSFSAEEIAKASLSLAQAGFTGEEVRQSISGIAFASQATGNTITDTSDAVITALKSMSLAADQSGRVADVFTAVANATKVKNFGEFSQALKYSGAIANEVGISFEELSSTIGFLSDRSIVGGQAGRHLRIILQSLISPTAEGRKELEKLGIQLKDSNGRFVGFANVLTQFNKATQDMGDEKLGIFKNIVGRDAMTSFQMLVQGGNDLSVVLEKVGNSAGIAQRQAKEMTDNLAGDVEKLDESINNLWKNIGETFAPIARETVQMFSWIINKATEYKDTIFSIAKALLDIKKATIDASVSIAKTGFNWLRTRGASEQAKKDWINQAIQLNPSLDLETAQEKLSQTLNAFAEAGTKREDMDRKIEEDISRMKNELMLKGITNIVSVKEKENKLIEEYGEEQVDITKRKAEEVENAISNAYRLENEKIESSYKAKLLALETSYTQQKITQNEYNAEAIKLEIQKNEAIKEVQIKYGKSTLDTEITIQKRTQDARKQAHDVAISEYNQTTKQISEDTSDALASIEFEFQKLSKQLANMPDGLAKITLLDFRLDYTELEKTKGEIKREIKEISEAFSKITSPSEAEAQTFNSTINSLQDRITDLKRKQDLLVLGIPEKVNEVLKANNEETLKLNKEIGSLANETKEFFGIQTEKTTELLNLRERITELRKEEVTALKQKAEVDKVIAQMEGEISFTKVSSTNEKEINAKQETLKGLQQISRSFYEQAEATRYASEQMKAYRTLLEMKGFSETIDKINSSLNQAFRSFSTGLERLGVDSKEAEQAFGAVVGGISEIAKNISENKALEDAFNAGLIKESDFIQKSKEIKAENVAFIASSAAQITDVWASSIDKQIEKENELIAKQQERVDKLKQGLQDGLTAQDGYNATALALEEERLAELEAQRQKSLEQQRVATALQLAFSAGAGVAHAFADYPFPFSAIVAGLTLASLLASVAVAQSQAQNAVAETGGRMTNEGFIPAGSTKKLQGKRHSQGGVLVEMEQGEYVFSRSHSQKFAPLFESIQSGKLKDISDLSFGNSVLEARYASVVNVDMSKIEQKLDLLARAIQSADRPTITLDEEGFFAKGYDIIQRHGKLDRRFK